VLINNKKPTFGAGDGILDTQNPAPARPYGPIPVSRYDPWKSCWTRGSVSSKGFRTISERRTFGVRYLAFRPV